MIGGGPGSLEGWTRDRPTTALAHGGARPRGDRARDRVVRARGDGLHPLRRLHPHLLPPLPPRFHPQPGRGWSPPPRPVPATGGAVVLVYATLVGAIVLVVVLVAGALAQSIAAFVA